MLQARLVPDACGTAARILKSSGCPPFCRKHGLDGAAPFMFPPLVLLSSASCSPSSPGCVPVPRTPLRLRPHALPRCDLLFRPGLHLKAPLMPLGANMKGVSLRLPSADGDLGSIHVLFSTGE